jgi:signal transduction histidine kinase/ligand-binding sensor domain-containing protein
MPELPFERLSVEHGLSFNEVYSILQDSRGFMWFGTFNGLNRYDGYTFTVYKPIPADSTTMSAGSCNTRYEDALGNFWINNSSNLTRYDRTTDRFARCLKGLWTTTMCEDTVTDPSRPVMWFATLGGGVHRYDEVTRTFTQFLHSANDPSTINSDSVFSVFVDRSGMLWVGTARGLNSFDGERFIHYAQVSQHGVFKVYEDPDTSSNMLWIGGEDALYAYERRKNVFSKYEIEFGGHGNEFQIIHADSKGRLWVGWNGGIALFDRTTWRFLSSQEIQSDRWGYVTMPLFIGEDNAGTLYMTTTRGPLYVFDEQKERWAPINIATDHPYTFHELYKDRTGTMWFGTVADGVLKIDKSRKPFTVYKNVPGDPSSMGSSSATGISQDTSGFVWVGTLGGLSRLDPATGTFTHFKNDPRNHSSLGDNLVWPVLDENNGSVWVGTHGGNGLERFDKKKETFQHYGYYWVSSLFQDRQKTLWVGTGGGGVLEFDRKANTFRRHFPPYTNPANLADTRAIVEDHEGLIWIAVMAGGVKAYNRATKMWANVSDYHSTTGANKIGGGLHALCVDREGTVWVGTHSGLQRFNKHDSTFTAYLAGTYISGILEDNQGNLWLSSTDGIFKFDPRTGKVRKYDTGDGVTIWPSAVPTGYKSRTGEMFFGGMNGLLRFHPDSIRDNPHVPPVVITGFFKFNQPAELDTAISEKEAIELSYKDNMITFEFAALNYTSPEKNQYAHQMVGFDTGWVYCGTERKATYTNLDGGTYIFRVKGSNNDGIWNEEGTSIAVIINPPFWKTWWFTTLAFVSLLLSVGGTIRYVEKRKLMRRIEQLKNERAIERERARISQDMHDEVGSSLSEIAILSELGRKRPEEAETRMQEISDRASELIDNVSEIVWAMNPKNDTLDNLVAHLRRYAVKYLSLAQINCKFTAPDVIPAHHLTAEVRRNLFLVVKEALHNVVKHAGASEVCLTLSLNESILMLHIEDNGKGFNSAASAQLGNGLESMKKRMQDIRGAFTIVSTPGEGTRIDVSLRVQL